MSLPWLSDPRRPMVSPREIPYLQAWYDASDPSTMLTGANVPVTDGGAVALWKDKSGNSPAGERDYQAAEGLRPTWTRSGGLAFNGSERMVTYSFSIAQPATRYTLCRLDTWQSGDVVAGGLLAGEPAVVQTGSAPSLSLNAGSSDAATTALVLGDWGVLVSGFSGAQSFFRVNLGGQTAGNPGSGSYIGLSLMGLPDGSGMVVGAIKCDLLYSALHDNNTVARVVRYIFRTYSVLPDAFMYLVDESGNYFVDESGNFLTT